MLRSLLKSDVWKWNGLLALTQNTEEVHRDSTRQEQGQYTHKPFIRFGKGLRGQQDVESGKGGGHGP